MFGVGFLEMVVVAIAALVLFGPEKLPEIAAQIGRFFIHFRKITNDVRYEIDEAIRQAEDNLVIKEREKNLQTAPSSTPPVDDKSSVAPLEELDDEACAQALKVKLD